MSSFLLRLTALVCMFVDHAGLALFPHLGIFRCVGRLAFPIYCFLLVQGFIHARSIRRYSIRLLLLALVSEIPFDLLIFGRPGVFAEQNVAFSLLLALCTLQTLRLCKKDPVQCLLIVLTLAVCSMALRVSFGWLGIALCLVFYLTQDRPLRMSLYAGGTLLAYTSTLLFSGVAHSWVLVSLCSLFALPILLLYSGKPGTRAALLSFLFYAAYPLHLLALYLIRIMRIVPPYFI